MIEVVPIAPCGRDPMACCACALGVCSWCGHEDCPDPAHGAEPGHGENSPCVGCTSCADYFGEDEP